MTTRSSLLRKAVAGVSTLVLLFASTLSYTGMITRGQAANPTAQINASNAAPTIGDTVILDGTGSTTSAGGAYTANPANLNFAWSLITPGGASTLSSFNSDTTSFVPDVAGEYRVQMVVTDPETGTFHQTETAINAQNGENNPGDGNNPGDDGEGDGAIPTARLNASSTTPTVGMTVNLDATTSTTSTGAAFQAGPPANLTFAWSLTTPGGAAVLSSFNTATTSFVPDVAGNYLVQLVVFDPNSNPANASHQIDLPIVASNADNGNGGDDGGNGGGGGGGAILDPTAQLTFTPANPQVGTTVNLNGTTSTTGLGAPFNGSNLTFAWSLTTPGGAAVLSSFNTATTSFVPDVAGNYTVQMVVIDNSNNASNQTQVIINVTNQGGGNDQDPPPPPPQNGGGGPHPPTANFTITPDSGGAPLPVTFDASSSTGIGLLTYEWDWEGNGAFDTFSLVENKVMTFVYELPGNYNATLRVTDTGTGLTSTANRLISVGTYNTGGGTSIFSDPNRGSIGGGTVGTSEGISGLILEKEARVGTGEFFKADTEATALNVGRNREVTVTFQVRIMNLTNLSVTRIVLEDAFYGDKMVRQTNIRNISGASFDPATRQFTVERTITNNETASFTYDATLTSTQAQALAYNTMTIVDYEVRDNFNPNKADIGLSDSAYIQFGGLTTRARSGVAASPVNIYVPTSVATDKTEVRAGESVNYTISISNNTDQTLTNVIVRDDYDETLVDVAPTGGSSNGSEITFEVGNIEPGETRTLSYRATVKAEAENMDTTLTNRVSVFTDQYADQAFAMADIRVAPKFAGFLAGATRTLPKTGLPLVGIALASLAVAGFATRKSR